jgi:hypothetical protein
MLSLTVIVTVRGIIGDIGACLIFVVQCRRQLVNDGRHVLAILAIDARRPRERGVVTVKLLKQIAIPGIFEDIKILSTAEKIYFMIQNNSYLHQLCLAFIKWCAIVFLDNQLFKLIGVSMILISRCFVLTTQSTTNRHTVSHRNTVACRWVTTKSTAYRNAIAHRNTVACRWITTKSAAYRDAIAHCNTVARR